MQNYDNYFRNHYNYSFTKTDLLNYKKWFYSQWQEVKKYLPKDKNLKILEIGSGIGWTYQFLNEELREFDYTGIELDQDAVDFSNQFFQVNSFRKISFDDYEDEYHSYDIIFAFEVLEHLENPSKSVRKIYSLLRKDGVFIGTSPFPFRKNILADETHISVLHPDNWKRIFLYSWFSQVNISPMSFLPYIWRINPKFNFKIKCYISFKNFPSTSFILLKK